MLLRHSMFYDVLFPSSSQKAASVSNDLSLRRLVQFRPNSAAAWRDVPIVVFDLETTGLDPRNNLIIEIGALKIHGDKVLDQFESLVSIDGTVPDEITRITGIDSEMLRGQPRIPEVMANFLSFIRGCPLVAHNAPFDISFIKASCDRLSIDIDWPVYCTLKMARDLLPDLERRNLDSLAAYYELTFEARHRSIGDVKVTSEVLRQMLASEGRHLTCLGDWQAYKA